MIMCCVQRRCEKKLLVQENLHSQSCPGSFLAWPITYSRVPLVPVLVASAMLGELLLPEITNLGGCLQVASLKSCWNNHGINSDGFQIKGLVEATQGNWLPPGCQFLVSGRTLRMLSAKHSRSNIMCPRLVIYRSEGFLSLHHQQSPIWFQNPGMVEGQPPFWSFNGVAKICASEGHQKPATWRQPVALGCLRLPQPNP